MIIIQSCSLPVLMGDFNDQTVAEPNIFEFKLDNTHTISIKMRDAHLFYYALHLGRSVLRFVAPLPSDGCCMEQQVKFDAFSGFGNAPLHIQLVIQAITASLNARKCGNLNSSEGLDFMTLVLKFLKYLRIIFSSL